jgi:uncharacterized membrane protein YczE
MVTTGGSFPCPLGTDKVDKLIDVQKVLAMKKIQFLKKICLFLFGLYSISAGIVLSVQANLGVTPISSLPYVYDLITPLTLGQAMIVFSILMMLLQILLMGRAYRFYQLIQLPLCILFGYFIDMNAVLLRELSVNGYLSELLLCLMSCLIIGFGVFLQFKAELIFLPVEGVAWAISKKFNIEFSKSKICIDGSMLTISLVSSLVFLPNVQGIREGTFIGVFLVGFSVKMYDGTLRFLCDRRYLSGTIKLT